MQDSSPITIKKFNLKIQTKCFPSQNQFKDIELMNVSLKKSISLKNQNIKHYQNEDKQLASSNLKKQDQQFQFLKTTSTKYQINQQSVEETKQQKQNQQPKKSNSHQQQRYTFLNQQSNVNVNDLLQSCRKTQSKLQENQNNKNLSLRKSIVKQFKGQIFEQQLQLFDNQQIKNNLQKRRKQSGSKQPNLFMRSSTSTLRSPTAEIKIQNKQNRIKYLNKFTQIQLPLNKFNPLSSSLILDKKILSSNLNQNQQQKFLQLIERIKDKKNKIFVPLKSNKSKQINQKHKQTNKINQNNINKQLTSTKISNRSSLLQSAVLWSDQRINLMKKEYILLKNQQRSSKQNKKTRKKMNSDYKDGKTIKIKHNLE